MVMNNYSEKNGLVLGNKLELECFEFKMHYAKSKAFLVALK